MTLFWEPINQGSTGILFVIFYFKFLFEVFVFHLIISLNSRKKLISDLEKKIMLIIKLEFRSCYLLIINNTF